MKRVLFALVILGTLLFMGKKYIFDFIAQSKSNQSKVTIFIHGSRSAAVYVLPKRYQSKLGLHSVSEYEEDSHFSELANILQGQDPEKYVKKDFYVFGWGGALSFNVRKNLAKNLYHEMVTLLNFYKQRDGIAPAIKIITFSHGGNIALQLSDFLPFIAHEEVLIDLTLIGSPVQAATEQMVECSQFANVSVISSRGDVIQRMDPHNLYGPKRDKKTRAFSRRFFDVQDFNEEVQQKITQYAVTINKKKLGHIDLFKSFMVHVPYVLSQKSNVKLNEVLNVNIQDPGFIFNKVYNLSQSLQGKRTD
jgi:hypothetical protein